MSAWKNGLIRTYRYATWPWRKFQLMQSQLNETVPVAILFYHRVSDENPNPWTISGSGFERQIDWLQQNFDLVSLREAQRRIKSGNQKPAVSITFDDGYAENCSFALPLLIERNIPVTYFVTTYHTTHNKAFQHDIEREQLLPANSIESLRALANAGVAIGGHTRTHVNLGEMLDEKQLFDEVIASTREMESMLDCSIDYFAFPYGQKENLDTRVFNLLLEHGFSGVCSAYGGLNEIHGDEFHLQRIHGDANLERLKNWLTGDPRIKGVSRYDWQAISDTTKTKKPTQKLNQPVESPAKF